LLVAKSELSYYPVEELERQEKNVRPKKKTKQKQRRNQNQRQNRATSFVKLVFLSIPMIILGISLLILVRYANITAVRQDITKLEREQIELEKTKMNLIAELEGIKSSEKIAEDAMFKLGMDYPTEGQIRYISVKDSSNKYENKFNSQNQFKKVFTKVASLF